jgi:hypothetical protein
MDAGGSVFVITKVLNETKRTFSKTARSIFEMVSSRIKFKGGGVNLYTERFNLCVLPCVGRSI